jgi:hypothetical protein
MSIQKAQSLWHIVVEYNKLTSWKAKNTLRRTTAGHQPARSKA